VPIAVVRLGTPRKSKEGLRLGTVRRPPRGVPKTQFAKRDFYDVWLPILAPSPKLVAFAQRAQDQRFFLLPSVGCRLCLDLTYRSSQEHDKRMDIYRQNPNLVARAVKAGSLSASLFVFKRLMRMGPQYEVSIRDAPELARPR